jgi:hypothetical protein
MKETIEVSYGGKPPLEQPMTYERCPNCNGRLKTCNDMNWVINFYCTKPGTNYHCDCGWKHINHYCPPIHKKRTDVYSFGR